VSVKFNSVLLNEENEDLQEIIDTLNIVLTLMASMNVAFEQPSDRTAPISQLINKLNLLSRSYAEHTKNHGGEKEEVGYFALKIKCDYAREALDRIKMGTRIGTEEDVQPAKGTDGE